MKNTIAQQIMNEGRSQEREDALETLLDLGKESLGEPAPEALVRLRNIPRSRDLIRLTARLSQVRSWDALLQTLDQNNNGNGNGTD